MSSSPRSHVQNSLPSSIPDRRLDHRPVRLLSKQDSGVDRLNQSIIPLDEVAVCLRAVLQVVEQSEPEGIADPWFPGSCGGHAGSQPWGSTRGNRINAVSIGVLPAVQETRRRADLLGL